MDEKDRVRFYTEILTATMERTIKRMWILAIMLVLLLVGTNLVWIIYESQFEDVVISQEVEQETESGENNFIGGDYYGDTED